MQQKHENINIRKNNQNCFFLCLLLSDLVHMSSTMCLCRFTKLLRIFKLTKEEATSMTFLTMMIKGGFKDNSEPDTYHLLPGQGVSLTVGGVHEVHHAVVLVLRGDSPGARGPLGRQVGRGRHYGHQRLVRAKNQVQGLGSLRYFTTKMI